jgi:hypothetical protein
MTSAYKYIIPADDITEADKATMRRKAIDAAMARAIETRVVVKENEALVRSPEPVTDFGMAVGGWLAPAFAAIGTLVTVFNAVAAPQLANNRVVVWYGMFAETIPLGAYRLDFREGAAGGSTYAIFELDELGAALQTRAYFSEPVWYDPQRVMLIQWAPRAVIGAGQRMGLLGFIIEPKGPTVSQ